MLRVAQCKSSLSASKTPSTLSARKLFPLTTAQPIRIFSRNYAATEIWEDREKSLENQAVMKHDQELIQKLKAAEAAKQQAEERAKQAEAKIRPSGQFSSGASIREDHEEHAPQVSLITDKKSSSAPITMAEFLDFRKELIEKIRDLEDEIHELRYDKYSRK